MSTPRKSFSVVADHFFPAITALQKFLGVDTEDLFYSSGEGVGYKVAEKYPSWDMRELLYEVARAWQTYEIGKLEVEKTDSVTLVIYNCTVCGQLAGTGNMFDCAFHEEFFKGLLGANLRRKVNVTQEANFEGSAGTWCRRCIADIKI